MGCEPWAAVGQYRAVGGEWWAGGTPLEGCITFRGLLSCNFLRAKLLMVKRRRNCAGTQHLELPNFKSASDLQSQT